MGGRKWLAWRRDAFVGRLERTRPPRHLGKQVAAGAAVGMGVAFVEVHLGDLGHGTHLLFFLLVVLAVRLVLGAAAAWIALAVAALGATAASALGAGPADPLSKVATQLALYIAVGGIILGALSALTALRLPDPPRTLPSPSHDRPVDPLTDRELEVLRLAASGLPVKGIAEAMYLSPNTVKTHLSHAYDKLDVQNRSEAVRAALHCGCVTPGDICPHRGAAREDRSNG